MATAKSASAAFVLDKHMLSLVKSGTDKGIVTSSPYGIECGDDCSATYTPGTPATLTATPDPGSAYVGYSGDPDCTDGNVTMNADKGCVATFNLMDGPDLSGTWMTLTQRCTRTDARRKCQLKGKVRITNQSNQKAAKNVAALAGDGLR